MEWLHDWIVVSKRIVQKYTIEALHVDRNALKKKYRNSLSSPVTDEMRRPSAFRNSMAEVLRAPRFSTTIGWKMWCCWRSMYLTDFLSAACSATKPDSLAATSTCESASVLTTVTSQTRGLPFCHGINESGLAICRFVCISLSALLWMEHRQSWGLTRQYRSEHDACGNSAWCFSADHGVACLCINLGTTTASGTYKLTPNLMPTATRTASSSSRILLLLLLLLLLFRQ